MVAGYDLDDTLADVNYELAGQIGLANVFSRAGINYRPTEDFVVITARPHDRQEYRDATRDWLNENFGFFQGIYYVSGTESEIVAKKAEKIRTLNLDSFSDNNVTILGLLKKELGARVPLYRVYADGRRERY